MTIELVIFDLGRVLIAIQDDWASAAKAAGIAWTEEQTSRLVNARDALSDISHAFECGHIEEQQFVAEIAAILKVSEAAVQTVTDQWIIEPYTGIHDLLADVKSSGRKVACLSNTNANHWAQMDDPDHDKYVGTREMDWAFASQNLRARKPESVIYEKVESITNVAPKHILFFDDLEINLTAPRSRGWNTFRVDPSMEPVAEVRGYLQQVGVLT